MFFVNLFGIPGLIISGVLVICEIRIAWLFLILFMFILINPRIKKIIKTKRLKAIKEYEQKNNLKKDIKKNNKNNKNNKYVLLNQYDKIFKLPENEMLEEFINRELIKAQIDKASKLLPKGAIKRKNVFNITFSFLLFFYIVLIFFHFPILTYILGLIILIIFYIFTKRYNLMKYLKQQLKLRPSEKISNIVMNAKETLVKDNSNKILLLGIIIAITLPIIIFMKPVILYEKMDNGYGVRFYAFGITNFTTATIPEKHKGKDVISLRGNTFSNMFLLEQVTLPNTITEIRGQAFKNNYKLKNVNIPEKLEYLGGGAFYNCKSLTSIEFPDTVTYIGGQAFKNNYKLKSVNIPKKLEYLGGGAFYNCESLESIEFPNTVTYIGGETFYNASSLKSVKLSNNITEIRGSTFENCKSLESIKIPDKVTRIGGHAFYGNRSLSNVYIGKNSNLKEIGSSAFRSCNRLREITIPPNTYVNERAFKESPTEVKEFKSFGSFVYVNEDYVKVKLGENSYIINNNSYIKLESIVGNNIRYEYSFKYVDDNGEKLFTLTSENKSIIIDDNLAIDMGGQFSSFSFFSYNENVYLYIYYN